MPTPTYLHVCCSVALAALLSACQSAPTATPGPAATPSTAATAATPAPSAATSTPEAPPAILVGAGVDAHGCRPSAGYAWCAQTNRCERPWELALQRGFANSPAGWQAFCENKTR